jgi:hypothetical protein
MKFRQVFRQDGTFPDTRYILVDELADMAVGNASLKHQMDMVNKLMCHNADDDKETSEECENLTAEIWPKFSKLNILL